MPHHVNILTRIRRSAILILLLTALLPYGADAAKQWQLRVSDNQRFLQYADGTPFFWLGDTGWLLPIALDRGSAKGYLAECARKGFNVVQVQVLSGVPSINCYGQLSNVGKSNPWDFSTIDREGVYGYWDHMDYIVEEAERQGIYIGMTCIWGGLVKGGAIDVAGAKAYGEFLARRYESHPNIIWIMGGDIQGDIKPEIWQTLATTIKATDTKHLMTYHPRGRYTSAKWWAEADWLDFHMYQSGHRAYGQRMGNKDYPIPDNTEEDCFMYIDSTWAQKPLKPVVDGEPSYEDIPVGLHFPDGPRWKAHDVRRYAYWDVFGGAFGHTYGHNAIMQMHTPGKAVAYASTSRTWWEAQQDSGYVSMQYLKALMLSLPFFERVPDQSVVVNNGARYDRLAATRGTDYILVYNYTSRPMEIDATKISGARKDVWWMDASNGSLAYLGEYKGKVVLDPKKAITSPSASDIHDGVLIITDSSKDYLSKEQHSILKPVKSQGKKDLTE